jgi:hypothetical protein
VPLLSPDFSVCLVQFSNIKAGGTHRVKPARPRTADICWSTFIRNYKTHTCSMYCHVQGLEGGPEDTGLSGSECPCLSGFFLRYLGYWREAGKSSCMYSMP